MAQKRIAIWLEPADLERIKKECAAAEAAQPGVRLPVARWIAQRVRDHFAKREEAQRRRRG